jgi:hypothetical protein
MVSSSDMLTTLCAGAGGEIPHIADSMLSRLGALAVVS